MSGRAYWRVDETIRLSEAFREDLEAHRRDEETMEETLCRLVGGPHPDALAAVIGVGADVGDGTTLPSDWTDPRHQYFTGRERMSDR